MPTKTLKPSKENTLPEVKMPIYDIHKTWTENAIEGPFFNGEIPSRKILPESQWTDFLGYRVASPLGVPSGPLLNSRWIALAARLGFDIVAYKTMRSHPSPSHPLPNVIFVEPIPGQPQVAMETARPKKTSEITITNSFGNPSMPPEFLLQDIAKARSSLQKGQVLIVSVFGVEGHSGGVAQDFVKAAEIAKAGGAHIIEANFSCPNVHTKEGALFCDPESSYHIASLLAKAAAPLPLLIKVGRYPNRELLSKVLTALSKANVRGVCGINTISMKVINRDNAPALGKDRETSGVCGNFIRPMALDFLKTAREIISKERLDLELAGCGGIMQPEHFDEFLSTGAVAAMSATGMMWDPYLAIKWHQQKEKER